MGCLHSKKKSFASAQLDPVDRTNPVHSDAVIGLDGPKNNAIMYVNPDGQQMELEPFKKWLDDGDYKSTETFQFKGKYLAKVVKVYDGDTITCRFWHAGKMIKKSVRIIGYDAPELKGSPLSEKTHAIKARDFLAAKIMNGFVWMDCLKTEKYGRILANIQMYGDPSVNGNVHFLMLDHKFAIPYYGKTKNKFVYNSKGDWVPSEEIKKQIADEQMKLLRESVIL